MNNRKVRVPETDEMDSKGKVGNEKSRFQIGFGRLQCTKYGFAILESKRQKQWSNGLQTAFEPSHFLQFYLRRRLRKDNVYPF